MEEVLPLIPPEELEPSLISSDAASAAIMRNIALRHPDRFTGFLSMSGAFDITRFLHGYYDNDVYFHTPPHFIPNLSDPWFFDTIAE